MKRIKRKGKGQKRDADSFLRSQLDEEEQSFDTSCAFRTSQVFPTIDEALSWCRSVAIDNSMGICVTKRPGNPATGRGYHAMVRCDRGNPKAGYSRRTLKCGCKFYLRITDAGQPGKFSVLVKEGLYNHARYGTKGVAQRMRKIEGITADKVIALVQKGHNSVVIYEKLSHECGDETPSKKNISSYLSKYKAACKSNSVKHSQTTMARVVVGNVTHHSCTRRNLCNNDKKCSEAYKSTNSSNLGSARPIRSCRSAGQTSSVAALSSCKAGEHEGDFSNTATAKQNYEEKSVLPRTPSGRKVAIEMRVVDLGRGRKVISKKRLAKRSMAPNDSGDVKNSVNHQGVRECHSESVNYPSFIPFSSPKQHAKKSKSLSTKIPRNKPVPMTVKKPIPCSRKSAELTLDQLLQMEGATLYNEVFCGFCNEIQSVVFQSVEKTPPNGHCGYHCVDIANGYDTIDGWIRVRYRMHQEFTAQNNRSNIYTYAMDSKEVGRVARSIPQYEQRVGCRYWMKLPQLGPLIATTFNMGVVVICSDGSTATYLPYKGDPSVPPKVMCIANWKQLHWFHVTLKPQCPLPPVEPGWRSRCMGGASRWGELLADRFQAWSVCFPPRVTPTVVLEE